MINEQNILIFLVQVLLLLGCARILGEVFRRFRQPPLAAEILVGILLGPTVFGRFMPGLQQALFPHDLVQQNMLETVGWLGILFFLLVSGLEIDFSSAWRQRGAALKIALADILIPMIVAFVPIFFLPDSYLVDPRARIMFAMFMATVMTISALPIAARVLQDLAIYKTELGFLIMSALSVNDIIGWLIFTVILGFFTQANLEIVKIVFILSATIGFAVFCLTLGRTLTNAIISRIKNLKIPEPGMSLTFICLLGLLCGAITQKIGIHALFGFFIAGIMAGEARALSEKTRQIITQMVHAIFVPIFFAAIGLTIDFFKNFDVFLVLLISGIGIAGRFYGAWVGTKFARVAKSNRALIAAAHTPGGTMEVVVGIIALEYNLITEKVFVAIIFGAVFSAVILGPWMSYLLKKRKEISVLEFFSARGIIGEIRAQERDDAIRELCDVANGQGNLPDVETIYTLVVQRENEMGTALEEGIAIPHARLSSLHTPIVVFGRSPKGIEWNSPDGKLAQYIFLILTPHDDEGIQVQILAHIARTIGKKEIRDAILRAHDAQEIWTILHEALTYKRIVRR
jgi:Kef-type K+ transport system membrane component KefB/mannitol/fructose-specific phosphotransferase system IIA component (Ntr-type)